MALIARWTFAGMGGLWDETENWQKAELLDNARLTHRGLELPKSGGWARVRPAPGVEINLTKKTLISWVILDDLTDKKPGGSALTLDAIQEDNFDGIVFGELADVAWMAGSTNYTRTATPNNENPAEKESGKLLKLAVSYGATPDGKAEIKIYRNDKLSRTYQQGVLATHSANDLEALFGARLTIGNKPIGHLIATIVAAEIHDQTLSDQEIAARQLDDPATFVRRTVSLRSVNNPENFIGVYEKTGVELFPATPPDPTNTKERVTWVLIPGLADQLWSRCKFTSPRRVSGYSRSRKTTSSPIPRWHERLSHSSDLQASSRSRRERMEFRVAILPRTLFARCPICYPSRP